MVCCGMSVAWMDYRVSEGVQNGAMKKCGVKLLCGVDCGVILNVLWYGSGYVCSVQSSLLFLYYVVFIVMSVQYVSVGFSVHSAASVYSVGSVL